MNRSTHKGKGKGSAAPRRETFDNPEDDRSYRGHRADDLMEVDYPDDRRDERGNDRGGDRRAARRDDPKDDEWDYRSDMRRDDPRGPTRDDRKDDRRDERGSDRGGDRRAPRRDDLRDDEWEYRSDMRRDDLRSQGRIDRKEDRMEGVSDGLITQCFPTTGIEWEVIAGDIQIYLGPEASVKMGPDPDDSRQMAYWVKAKNNTLTQHMVADLMADSLAWKNEKIRDPNSQSYIITQTHRERQQRGPSRRLPVPPPPMSRSDQHDRHRLEGAQSISTAFSTANRATMGTSPPTGGDMFAQSINQSRHTLQERLQDQSFLTRQEAENIIARRLRDAGRTGITRGQLESLIDEALGQASRTQVLTREQAQTIIAQRLRDKGHTNVTKSQLEGLIDSQVQKSKEQNIDRAVNEAIQKSQERPTANQARPAAQVPPPKLPPSSNPDPDGTFGHSKVPDYSRHNKAG